jgi:hypothetical protein
MTWHLNILLARKIMAAIELVVSRYFYFSHFSICQTALTAKKEGHVL